MKIIGENISDLENKLGRESEEIYTGYIFKLRYIKEHKNADNLQVAVLSDKKEIVIPKTINHGDLCVFFHPDTQLSLDYCIFNNLLKSKGGFIDDKQRRVKINNIRGQISEGLILPISSLELYGSTELLKPGHTLETLELGHVACRYKPPEKDKKQFTNKLKVSKKREFPFFVKNKGIKYIDFSIASAFRPDDEVIITEKIHGSSSRHSYALKIKTENNYTTKTWERIFGNRSKRITPKYMKKSPGFYKNEYFRQQVHDTFADKLQKGETIMGDIVGWTSENEQIMPTYPHIPLKNPNFNRLYGKESIFKYGCEKGNHDFFAWRGYMINEDGYIVEYNTHQLKARCDELGIKMVPILDKFLFTNEKDMLKRINKLENGTSTVDSSHIREGVCIRNNSSPLFTVFKHKNKTFKILEQYEDEIRNKNQIS